jgi:hypothetical protein
MYVVARGYLRLYTFMYVVSRGYLRLYTFMFEETEIIPLATTYMNV